MVFVIALNRLGICQKIYTTQFTGKRILHTKNAQIETIFASNKQQKCIIISNLALFWLKLNKMCKFFNSYEESLHFGMCKLAKYIRNCVVFWKNLHSWQNFTRPPVATVATNSKSVLNIWSPTRSQLLVISNEVLWWQRTRGHRYLYPSASYAA